MPELITKEPTELEERVAVLEMEVQQKDIELNQAKVKKRPSIGYFRSRFK